MSFSISGILSAVGSLKTIKHELLPSSSSSFAGSSATSFEPFKALGVTLKQYEEHLAHIKSLEDSIAYQDLFVVELDRAAPTYPLEKSKVICEFIQAVDVTHDSLDTTEVQLGSGYINLFEGLSSATINITFTEFKSGDVRNFLTMKDSGNSSDIGKGSKIIGMGTNLLNDVLGTSIPNVGSTGDTVIPSDGSYLLPFEFYFNLKVSRVYFDGDTTAQATIYDGQVLLDGNISESLAVGNAEIATLQANFKPLMSFV